MLVDVSLAFSHLNDSCCFELAIFITDSCKLLFVCYEAVCEIDNPLITRIVMCQLDIIREDAMGNHEVSVKRHDFCVGCVIR